MPSASPDPGTPRLQRALAAGAFAVIGISAIAVVALLITRGAGLPEEVFRSPGMVVLQLLPLPGLTVGLLLVIALIVSNAIARSRRTRN